MKAGIVVMAELHGELADRVAAIQQRFDPRMANELPPHITLTGSSGAGPIPADTPVTDVQRALAAAAAAIEPFTVRFGAPERFMQSTVVVLPVSPNGPIRALHERIIQSGLHFERPRFTFTPHCTLSFYPELAREALRELLRIRVDAPVLVDRIQGYRSLGLTRTERIADCPLGEGTMNPEQGAPNPEQGTPGGAPDAGSSAPSP
jgi:2'-5' RNA ligase